MGLDVVELVLDIEDEFGIHIEDAAVRRMATPAEAADYLLPLLRTNTSDPCPSQAGFYRLRRALVAIFGVPRNTVRPDTSLDDLFAGHKTRTSWFLLQHAVGARALPQLRPNLALSILATVLAPATIAGFLASKSMSPLWVAGAFMTSAVFLYSAAKAHAGTTIPHSTSTVADLLPFVSPTNSSLWDRSAVKAKVIELTAKITGIPAASIAEDDSFVDDLGMG